MATRRTILLRRRALDPGNKSVHGRLKFELWTAWLPSVAVRRPTRRASGAVPESRALRRASSGTVCTCYWVRRSRVVARGKRCQVYEQPTNPRLRSPTHIRLQPSPPSRPVCAGLPARVTGVVRRVFPHRERWSYGSSLFSLALGASSPSLPQWFFMKHTPHVSITSPPNTA